MPKTNLILDDSDKKFRVEILNGFGLSKSNCNPFFDQLIDLSEGKFYQFFLLMNKLIALGYVYSSSYHDLYKLLCQAFIEQKTIKLFGALFVALKDVGFNYTKRHVAIFNKLINTEKNREHVIDVLCILKQLNCLYSEETKAIYFHVFEKTNKSAAILSVLRTLLSMKKTYLIKPGTILKLILFQVELISFRDDINPEPLSKNLRVLFKNGIFYEIEAYPIFDKLASYHHLNQSDKVDELFNQLNKIGFSYAPEKAALFSDLIDLCHTQEKKPDVGALVERIQMLLTLGYNYKGAYHELYLIIIRSPIPTQSLRNILNYLSQTIPFIKQNLAIYNILLNPCEEKQLLAVLKLLKQIASDYSTHCAFYQRTVYSLTADLADALSEIYSLIGCYSNETRSVYNAVLNQPGFHQYYPLLFDSLNKLGIPFSEKNHEMYALVILHAQQGEDICRLFDSFIALGLGYDESHQIFYRLAIRKASECVKLIPIFNLFNQAGMTEEATKRYFASRLLDCTRNASSIYYGLNELVKRKCFYTAHSSLLFENLFFSGLTIIEQRKIFEAFESIVPVSVEPALYALFMKNPIYLDGYLQLFSALRQYGFVYNKENALLFYAVCEGNLHANEIKNLLSALECFGCKYNLDTMEIYSAVLNGGDDPSPLFLWIDCLKQANYRYLPETHHLLLAVVQHASELLKPHVIINYLEEPLLFSKENEQLYGFIIQRGWDKAFLFSIKKTLDCIKQFNIKEKSKLYWFMIYNPEILSFYQFDFSIHSHQQLMVKLTESSISYQGKSSFSEQLMVFISQRFMENTDLIYLTSEDKKTYIEKVLDIDEVEALNQPALYSLIQVRLKMILLEYGPMNKNEATLKLEKLIHYLATREGGLGIKKNAHEEYEVQVFDKTTNAYQESNLTLLLRHANLSHLVYEEALSDTINGLGTALKDLIEKHGFPADIPVGSGAPSYLPEAIRQAIFLYSDSFYKNANRLFRGEALELDFEEKDTVLFSFLLGILVTYGINTLPGLLHQPHVLSKEKAILQKLRENGYLTDGKQMTQQEFKKLLMEPALKPLLSEEERGLLENAFLQLKPLLMENKLYRGEEGLSSNVITARTYRISKLQALTSTSYRNLTSFVVGTNKTLTFFKSAPPYPTINSLSMMQSQQDEEEEEVIIPPGIQLLTVPKGAAFEASIVASPSVDVEDYWFEHALGYCTTYHLSQPYREEDEFIRINNEVIYRPNHGLLHTLRVATYIPLVMDYFARHANDPGFKLFCQRSRHTRMERYLKLAAVFSISGRESECSASSDRERYIRYRKASKQHFLQYVSCYPDCIEETEKDRFADIILWMGNPDYPLLQLQKTSPDENHSTVYLYYLLTIAHKLDLPRCYDASLFEEVLKKMEALINPSSAQQDDLACLVDYAMSLITIQGDQLACKLTLSHKKLENVDQCYTETFIKLSQSLNLAKASVKLIALPLVSSHANPEPNHYPFITIL